MQYLSDEWLEAADAAVAGLEPTTERSYTLSLGPEVGVRPGNDAVVGLQMTWGTACAIATNQRGAQRAFLDGDLRIRGDAPALLAHQDRLEAVETRLAPLRAQTTY